MQIYLHRLSAALLLLLIFSESSIAGPRVKLCLDKGCKNPSNIRITDSCWSEVKDLYTLPFSTDKDEQDNILASIVLIQSDLYKTLQKQAPANTSASDLYNDTSNKNKYKNLRTYLGILMDNYLVKRHVMRKTITETSWKGKKIAGLLLQSVNDAQIYILTLNEDELQASPEINAYKKSTLTEMPYSLSFLNTEYAK